MIDISVDPILIEWSHLTLSWHGLFLALATISAYFICIHFGMGAGFSRDTLSKMAFWLAILGIIGARLVHVLEHWAYFAASPIRILAFRDGGLAIYGAILAVILGTLVYTYATGMNFWRLMDAIVIGVPLAFIIGRFGCLIMGDAWGWPTKANWGVVYWHNGTSIPSEFLGIPTFPAPIMLQLWNFGLLIVLLNLRDRVKIDGLLFSVYLIVYSLGRLIINTWQAGEILFVGLKFTQLLALGLIATGFILIIVLTKRTQGQNETLAKLS